MTYYTYRQNNSGGSHTKPAINLVVKADTPAEADAIAIANGVYFDPMFEVDCECCGNRWDSAVDGWVSTSDTIPEVSDWDLSWAKSEGIPAQLVIE